jgi:hypothetical protein
MLLVVSLLLLAVGVALLMLAGLLMMLKNLAPASPVRRPVHQIRTVGRKIRISGYRANRRCPATVEDRHHRDGLECRQAFYPSGSRRTNPLEF